MPDPITSKNGRTLKPFIERHPGERPVRCPTDGRIVATVVDFNGHLRVKCHSCKEWWHWTDVGGVTNARSQRMMRAVRCDACGGCVVLASAGFTGTVYARCRSCRADNKAVGVTRERHPLAHLDQDSFMGLMEERWREQFQVLSRRRAEVAVGLRFDVFKRDAFRCRYCGRSAADGAVLHADHVIPQSKGGPTTLDKLVTACFDCNIGKSAKDIDPSSVI